MEIWCFRQRCRVNAFFLIYHSTKGKIGGSGWRFGILRGLPQLYNPFHFRGSLRNPNHRAAKPPSQTVTWIIKTNEILGDWMVKIFTLQGINISHLGKRKLIFKTALERGMLVRRRVGDWMVKLFYHLQYALQEFPGPQALCLSPWSGTSPPQRQELRLPGFTRVSMAIGSVYRSFYRCTPIGGRVPKKSGQN